MGVGFKVREWFDAKACELAHVNGMLALSKKVFFLPTMCCAFKRLIYIVAGYLQAFEDGCDYYNLQPTPYFWEKVRRKGRCAGVCVIEVLYSSGGCAWIDVYKPSRSRSHGGICLRLC